jgi:hypothetical protein
LIRSRLDEGDVSPSIAQLKRYGSRLPELFLCTAGIVNVVLVASEHQASQCKVGIHAVHDHHDDTSKKNTD